MQRRKKYKISKQRTNKYINWLREVQISIAAGTVSMHVFVYKFYLHFCCLSFEVWWNHFNMIVYWQNILHKLNFDRYDQSIVIRIVCFYPKYLQNNIFLLLLCKCNSYNTENTKTFWECHDMMSLSKSFICTFVYQCP